MAARSVDLRSDTLTKPTAEMRQAMVDALVGDDVFDEDPTVKELEALAASLMGKEAALFVPTGTMGNLISVMVHCRDKGSEFLIGDRQHIYLYEGGSASAVASAHPRVARNLPDGTLDFDELEKLVRPDNVHFPKTRMLALEQTHNMCGGRVLSLAFMDEAAAFCKKHGLALHIDGARIFNAAVALDVPVKELAKHADSVTFCLSKGLGAPLGSVLVGSSDFIYQARRFRKMLGGGLRQVGVVAATGLVALNVVSKLLAADHERAKTLARGLTDCKGIDVAVDTVQTNIVMARITDKAALGSAADFATKLKDNGVVVVPVFHDTVRLCTYHQVNDDDIAFVIEAVRKICA